MIIINCIDNIYKLNSIVLSDKLHIICLYRLCRTIEETYNVITKSVSMYKTSNFYHFSAIYNDILKINYLCLKINSFYPHSILNVNGWPRNVGSSFWLIMVLKILTYSLIFTSLHTSILICLCIYSTLSHRYIKYHWTSQSAYLKFLHLSSLYNISFPCFVSIFIEGLVSSLTVIFPYFYFLSLTISLVLFLLFCIVHLYILYPWFDFCPIIKKELM